MFVDFRFLFLERFVYKPLVGSGNLFLIQTDPDLQYYTHMSIFEKYLYDSYLQYVQYIVINVWWLKGCYMLIYVEEYRYCCIKVLLL